MVEINIPITCGALTAPICLSYILYTDVLNDHFPFYIGYICDQSTDAAILLLPL